MNFATKILLFICFFSLYHVSLSAQGVKEGKVIDANDGSPIVGAFVFVDNIPTTNTDENGIFKINLSVLDSFLLSVKYVGYKTFTQKYSKNAEGIITIPIEEDINLLKEMVVTSSYGTEKPADELVGSMQSLSSNQLQTNQAVESFDKMLDGLATGVLVSASTTPGGPVKIDIRGQGALTQLNNTLIGSSTQPLFIIDGVVVAEEAGFDNERFNGDGSLAEQFKNPLSKISPDDIESITILKDAAAVGLYGADASNGVVIVKTKRKKQGDSSVSYNFQTGVSQPINQIKYLSGPQYHDIKKEIRLNFGDSEEKASSAAGSNTINTDWFALLNRNGQFHKHNLNLGYSIKNWSFRTSFNYLYNKEPQVGNSFNRTSTRLNFGYVSKKLTSQWTLAPTWSKQSNPNILFGFPLPPNIEAIDKDGKYTELGYNGLGNPLAVANENINNTNSFGMLGSWNLSYQILSYLKISSIAGVDISDKNQSRFFNGNNESGRFNSPFVDNGTVYPRWGRRLDYNRNSLRWNQSTQIYFEKTWGSHYVDVLAGLELQREKAEAQRILGTGFVNPTIYVEASQAKGSFFDNSILTESARRSMIFQINYDFEKKYFLLFNLRRDESSSFGGDTDPAINGGIGFSWNIHKESFLEKNSSIDLLKLRLSYGVTGNSRIGPYRSLGLYNIDVTGKTGYNGLPFATPSTPPNPLLSWERNYKFNIGIDLHFLKKFKLGIEFFNDNITDQIVSREVPLEVGFSSVQINGASMYNRGIETSIQIALLKNKNFQWTSNFNISSLENKVTDLKGLGDRFSSSELARVQRIGVPTSAIWGVKFIGIDPATGQELFTKNGEVFNAATYRASFDDKDWEIIGNTQPAWYGGWQNNFSYKKISLSIRASYRVGEDALVQDDFISKYSQIENRNLSINALDRWRKPGDFAAHPIASPFNPLIPNSSRLLYDASHVKIQNINVSYNITTKRKYLKGMNIFLDVSNVHYFYFSNPKEGRNGIAEFRFTYPEARTFTLGAQLNLF